MKLSIIIPAYNVEKYIKKTINSLIAQTKKGFEIIIVDDGSTDNTLKVISECIEENNLDYCKVIQKANGGVSTARNEGIEAAKGKYIMFLDGDDYVDKDTVEHIYKNIDEVGKDVLFWGCNIVDENGSVLQNYSDVYKLKQKNMTGTEALNNMINYKNMWLYTGSAVYRKEFLSLYNLRYKEGCANGEDQEFTIKSLSRAKTVAFIDKTLTCYVMRGTSISNSYNIKRFDAMFAMQRTYKYIDKLGDSELEIISAKMKNEHMVDNYIYNFDCCLDCIYKNGAFNKDSFKKLYDDIERDYPTLNREVISIMKKYSGKNIKILFKVKMFLTSPQLYSGIFKLKNKIKK
ncbi:glycosyltransferase [Clostridium algoriphilum]|uniref:glycosyltransferase family 2 protein n=1 Tax=Clostridium algoriphilum TaxID=198347 RepID=UPI001CF48E7A|nr:glycosyltransferase family 2 protein [Clostridium algoriphilum]MCB2293950.1 glycosyltransferase [Clostridium algoriphilum]